MRDIGDDEQRSVRPQMPVAQRVAAALGVPIENPYVRQIAIAPVEIKSVANNELIGDLKPDITNLNRLDPAAGLVKQCHNS